MKTAGWMLVAIGGGLALWAIGSRISTDAIGMMVGLIFGMLAGIPAALLVMAASDQRPTQEQPAPGSAYEAWSEGYAAGRRDAVAFGPVAQPPMIVVNPPADVDIDDITAKWTDAYVQQRTQYTASRPFGDRQFRIVGEVEP